MTTRLYTSLTGLAVLLVAATAGQAAPKPVPPRTIFLESHDLG